MHAQNLIANIIVVDDLQTPSESLLPYVRLKDLASYTQRLQEAEIPRCKLFVRTPVAKKDGRGTVGLEQGNTMLRAIGIIKQVAPNMDILTEVCACSYSDTGECALLDADGRIDDQQTHEYVGRMAVLHADAGATTAVAGLTHKGSVRAMRDALNSAGHKEVGVMASVQMASKFYGPYRNLMRTEPGKGNTHRSHTPVDTPERAIRLAQSFLEEGASELTIQPIMVAVDILYRLRQDYPDIPISAYSVSTELCLGSSEQGWLAEEKAAVVAEYYSYLLRAGATTVMSYVAPEMALWLKQSSTTPSAV